MEINFSGDNFRHHFTQISAFISTEFSFDQKYSLKRLNTLHERSQFLNNYADYAPTLVHLFSFTDPLFNWFYIFWTLIFDLQKKNDNHFSGNIFFKDSYSQRKVTPRKPLGTHRRIPGLHSPKGLTDNTVEMCNPQSMWEPIKAQRPDSTPPKVSSGGSHVCQDTLNVRSPALWVISYFFVEKYIE